MKSKMHEGRKMEKGAKAHPYTKPVGHGKGHHSAHPTHKGKSMHKKGK